MKVAIACWLATLFFAWLVVGKSLEQALLASKVLFVGMILGFLAGKVSRLIRDYRNTRTTANAFLRRK